MQWLMKYRLGDPGAVGENQVRRRGLNRFTNRRTQLRTGQQRVGQWTIAGERPYSAQVVPQLRDPRSTHRRDQRLHPVSLLLLSRVVHERYEVYLMPG